MINFGEKIYLGEMKYNAPIINRGKDRFELLNNAVHGLMYKKYNITTYQQCCRIRNLILKKKP